MKKKYLLVIIPILLGVICFISYNVIGSKIAQDGTLVEPFWLIPLGYLFSLIGIIALIVIIIKWKFKKNSK